MLESRDPGFGDKVWFARIWRGENFDFAIWPLAEWTQLRIHLLGKLQDRTFQGQIYYPPPMARPGKI